MIALYDVDFLSAILEFPLHKKYEVFYILHNMYKKCMSYIIMVAVKRRNASCIGNRKDLSKFLAILERN
jgi:hypothetical protein